jgi:hypothetical protein
MANTSDKCDKEVSGTAAADRSKVISLEQEL